MTGITKMFRRATVTATAGMLTLALVACGGGGQSQASESTSTVSSSQESTSFEAVSTAIANASTDGVLSTADLFTDRDLAQEADTSSAKQIAVKDGEAVSITEEGVYVLTGTASNVTVTVEADSSAKVQLVLDGVNITNTDAPAIYVKSADKVFVTTAAGSTNALTVTGSFVADGDTNLDAVVFSRDDLVFNGMGSLSISSTGNGVSSHDDLKVTGGTYTIDCTADGLEANDNVLIADGNITITSQKDGVHAENDEDNSTGNVYVSGGTLNINAASDGIQATSVAQFDGGSLSIVASEGIEGTYVQVNGGSIAIEATDDGINGSQKSTAQTPTIEIRDGNVIVQMGSGDTDALDVNGNLYISGGTVDISAQFPFDYDGEGQLTGGTVYVNGEQVSELTNQMMGGGPGMGGGRGMAGGPGMDGGPGMANSGGNEQVQG